MRISDWSSDVCSSDLAFDRRAVSMPPGSALARMEGSARILALIKLANVGLTLIWGFAVTYVFVRVLPLREFQSFLLLVAFGNFTISAEFGLTSIIYARLRRDRKSTRLNSSH